MKQRGKQQGFTIIELVVVILLLGILTATALPRFGGLTNSAHQAVVNSTFSALVASDNLFEAQWYADGQPTTTAMTATDYATLYANSQGNVIGTSDDFGAQTAALAATDCKAIFDAFINVNGASSVTAVAQTFATDAETTVEAATIGTSDFVATTDAAANATQCLYYYVGQFSKGDADPNDVTIPSIIYTVGTSNWTTGTLALDSDD